MFTLMGNSVCWTPVLCFFEHPSLSLVKFNSIDSTNRSSLSVSCLNVTKTTNLECFSNPDLVTVFFKNNGLSDSDISKVTKTNPGLLRCNVDKTLKPKFEFFKSQGISGSDFAQVVCQNPNVLKTSLEKKIIPCFHMIKSIVHTDAKLLVMLKRSPGVLMQDPHKNLLPNIALLRAQGVPADNISKLLIAQPRSFMKPTSGFREIVEEVKQMKFDPSQYMFLVAVHGLTSMTRSSLEAKFNIYRRWGLSEDEVQCIFRKNPYCLMISDENIMSTMSYYVEEMGYTPSLIAKQPTVMMYSLKRRIIPRCSVIQILKTKGLVENYTLSTLLLMSKEDFLTKFVIKFEKEVPEVLCAYKEKGERVV